VLSANQFGFRARHSATLQCMRLTYHVTLNFNNKMSTAAVLDIEKSFDTTWHPGLLYKLSNLNFSTRLMKLISSFLSQQFRVSVEGEISTPRYIQAGVPQGSVLSSILYNLYINDTPPNLRCKLSSLCRRHLSLCNRTQGGLCSEKNPAWDNFDGDKTRAIYFSREQRPPNSLLTLNGRNIPFVNSVKYLGIIFDKRMSFTLHIEAIEAKAFRTFVRLYSLFKSERLSANIKLTLHKALIRSVMTYAFPAWEFAAEIHPLKLQRLQNRVLRTPLTVSQNTRRSAICICFPNSVRLRVHNRIMQEANRSLPKS
jgi:hypothetical protein